MTKDDFLKLNKLLGQLPPDASIISQYLEKQFTDLGLSKENGYKSVQFFYNELCKAKAGDASVFKGKVVITDEYFGIVDATCYFKMYHKDFTERRSIYFRNVLTDNTEEKKLVSLKFSSHEQLITAMIYSANETEDFPIDGAFEVLKELWFFIHSDQAFFNGKSIEKERRPLLVNPKFGGKKPDFSNYFKATIEYNQKRNNVKLTESEFITETLEWIDGFLLSKNVSTERIRKLQEFSAYLNERRSDNKKSNGGVSNADKQLSFPECFVSDHYYNEFIQLMVDNKLLSAENHSSIATEKGNVSFLPAVIKALRSKGYYRSGVKLSIQSIKEICEKHFNHPVSYDTVKKAKPSDFDLNFIVVVPKKEN